MRVITIGTGADNDICLSDSHVSRHHCQIIENENGSCFIVDMQSTNGSYVNGKRVQGQVALMNNDVIRIGNTTLPWRSWFSGTPSSPHSDSPHSNSSVSNNKTFPTAVVIWIGIVAAVAVVSITILLSSMRSSDETVSDHHQVPEIATDYVDLGLPSGTLWKRHNEEGMYLFDYAVRHFDGFLPSSGQLQELIEHCTWEWTDGGFSVFGKNGNYIFISTQVEEYDEDLIAYVGAYWSTTKNNECCYGLLVGHSIIGNRYKVDRTCSLDRERGVILCRNR